MKRQNKAKETKVIHKDAYLKRLDELRDSPRIKFGEALTSLKENGGFKVLFDEEFFKNYPLRLIRLKADPSIILGEMGDKQIKTFDKIIEASGVLQMFLLQVEAEYKQTLEDISKIEEALKGK